MANRLTKKITEKVEELLKGLAQEGNFGYDAIIDFAEIATERDLKILDVLSNCNENTSDTVKQCAIGVVKSRLNGKENNTVVLPSLVELHEDVAHDLNVAVENFNGFDEYENCFVFNSNTMEENAGAALCGLCFAMTPKDMDYNHYVIPKSDSFLFNGMFITDPSMDETGRFEVNPVLYYKEAYCNYMIDKHTKLLDLELKPFGFSVAINETSEAYEDCDESDEYYDAAMYEAYIMNENEDMLNEDEITGRYYDIVSVIVELQGFVDNVIRYCTKKLPYMLIEHEQDSTSYYDVQLLPITEKDVDEGKDAEIKESVLDETVSGQSRHTHQFISVLEAEIQAKEILMSIRKFNGFDAHYTKDETVKSVVFDNDSQLGMLETYGDDFEQVREIYDRAPGRVWTVVDGDDGNLWIVSGITGFNRVYHFITNETCISSDEKYLIHKSEVEIDDEEEK